MNTSEKKPAGNDLAAFRAAHDKSYIVPRKIQAGLEALGNSWMYESKFVLLCQLSNTDFGAYREQFAAHCVETTGKNSKRVWCGTKEYAAKLRELPK